MAGAVSTAVDRCEELVAGLLTLARGEAVGVGDEPADLGRAARLALGDVGPDARSRRLAMTTDLQAAPVRGDRRLLERLVANLVENAVCHNVHGGRVEVTTGVRGDRAHVRVENTGAPIAPERVPRLLEPFVRGGEGGAAGSGLGLAIVRTIARAHGGAIVLTSRPGGGLVAEAVLPLRTGAPALASAPDRVDGRFGRRVRAPAR
jgi:signal transduction histidine kinase